MPRLRLSVVMFLATVAVGGSAAEPWPAFLGVRGDSIARGADVPDVIDDSSVRWRTAIDGRGWSSPIADVDQVWVTTAAEDGTTMSLIGLLPVDGSVFYDEVLVRNDDPAFCHPENSYASCTPTMDDDRVYAHFGSDGTVAIDRRTLQEVWRRVDLKVDHFRGAASSPVVDGDRLVLTFDGVDRQFVVALDVRTGRTVWKTDRRLPYRNTNPDWHKAYSTVGIVEPKTDDGDTRRWLASPAADYTQLLDPVTGEVVHRLSTGGMNASLRPTLRDNRLVLTNGMGAMSVFEFAGADASPRLVWEDQTSVAKKASPLIHDGVVYMNSDDGIVSARRLTDGRMLWRKRIGGAYAASPLMADGKIFFTSRRGDILVIRPGATYDEVSRSRLGVGFMASPAVVGDRMYLRDRGAVFAIGGRS